MLPQKIKINKMRSDDKMMIQINVISPTSFGTTIKSRNTNFSSVPKIQLKKQVSS